VGAVDPEVVGYAVFSEDRQPCPEATANIDHRLGSGQLEDERDDLAS
jgi:hypothetical protein